MISSLYKIIEDRTSVGAKEEGFTLVEMLVALAIFALLSAGATSAMLTAVNTKEVLEQEVLSIQDIQMTRALLRSDIDNIVLRPSRDPYGNREQYKFTGGTETLLSFMRGGRENPGGLEKRGGLQKVAYVFEDGNFIRRSYGIDFPAPQTPIRERVLMYGLDNVLVSFENAENYSVNQLYVPFDAVEFPVNMMTLTITFPGGQELVQKFELTP